MRTIYRESLEQNSSAKKKKDGIRIITGFESTRNTSCDGTLWDVLEQTEHDVRFKEDLKILHEKTGIRMIRVPVRWHQIEQVPGVYDFAWMDEYMQELERLEIEAIMDPLHHTSWPTWLTEGFADDQFQPAYEKFFKAVVDRYPYAKQYTIINEPLVTAHFCGQVGVWTPKYADEKIFITMLKNIACVTRNISYFLKEQGKEHVFIDACTYHHSLDDASEYHAEWLNELRFQLLDLMLGKVDTWHPLYEYFLRNGIPQEVLQDLAMHPVHIDILGLDYYEHCEFEWKHEMREGKWCVEHSRPNVQPAGCCEVALHYAERYELPIMLAETNIRGYITDRIAMFKLMVAEYEELTEELGKMGLESKGFCWFPFIDSACWGEHLCAIQNKEIDPVGIVYVDDAWNRHPDNEFVEIVAKVSRGIWTSADIPWYDFQPPVDVFMKGLAENYAKKSLKKVS